MSATESASSHAAVVSGPRFEIRWDGISVGKGSVSFGRRTPIFRPTRSPVPTDVSVIPLDGLLSV